jgi:HAD superfamily hydrolase (TIGR01509 family)
MTPFGVLWDLDGTLVDTGEFHHQAWAQTLAGRGIAYSREQFALIFGMNNLNALTTLLGRPPAADLLAEIDAEKEARFRAAIHGQVRPLPGALAWLARLRAAGVRQAIASSAPPANINVLVDELALRPYFDRLVAGAGLPSKPDPAIFLAAAEQLGLPPARCVVVEDSPAGVGAARRAGMRCVAVTQTNPAEALAGADRIVPSLEALPAGAFEDLLDAS